MDKELRRDSINDGNEVSNVNYEDVRRQTMEEYLERVGPISKEINKNMKSDVKRHEKIDDKKN